MVGPLYLKWKKKTNETLNHGHPEMAKWDIFSQTDYSIKKEVFISPERITVDVHLIPRKHDIKEIKYWLLLFQPQAREKAEKEGFEVSIAKTSFKANTKALAENEGEGMAKVIHNS